MRIKEMQLYASIYDHLEKGYEALEFLVDVDRGIRKERAINHNDYELYDKYYEADTGLIVIPSDKDLYEVYVKISDDIALSSNNVSELDPDYHGIFTEDILTWLDVASKLLDRLLNHSFNDEDRKKLESAEHELRAIYLYLMSFISGFNSIKIDLVDSDHSMILYQVSNEIKGNGIFYFLDELNRTFALISRFYKSHQLLKLVSVQKGSWEIVFAGIHSIITLLLLADKLILDRKKKQLEIQKLYLEIQKLKLKELNEIEKGLRDKFIIESEELSNNIFDEVLKMNLVDQPSEEQKSFLKSGLDKLVKLFIAQDTEVTMIKASEVEDDLLTKAYFDNKESYKQLILSELEIEKMVENEGEVKLLK